MEITKSDETYDDDDFSSATKNFLYFWIYSMASTFNSTESLSSTILFKKRRRNPKIHRGKNYKESGQCLLSLRWGWRRWRQGGWWRCWQQREWLCGLPSVWVSWEVSGSGETFLLPTERHCVALIAVQCKQRRSNAHSLQISELLVYLSVAELLFWVSRSQNNQYLPPILWVWSLSESPYLYYPSLY